MSGTACPGDNGGMIRGRTVLVLLAAGVIAACASSSSKPSGGGSGGSIGSDAGGAAGNGGAQGSGGSGATGGSGGSTPDATPPDAGGDTGTDTGTPDANPPDATQDASPDTGSDASTCGATSQQCGTSIACAPGDKCHALYTGTGVRDWPVDTDATGPVGDSGGGTCTDSKGNDWPSEGVGSATWFEWGSCGSYKTFPVTSGCAFDILSYNDCCSGCVLNDVNIDVQEKINGTWTTQTTISHPYTGQCEHWDDVYIPKTSQVRLQYAGSAGSYVCVFQQ